MRIAYTFLLLTLLTTGCQKTIDDDLPESTGLVIEGWIDSDGHPTVLLTRSFSPMNTGETSLSDLVVRWAEVTISDGTDTEVMIGRINRQMVPPFMYTTDKIIGRPGKTYTVTASYDGNRVTSHCTMPEPVRIEDINIIPIADCDTLREVRISFTPVPDGYYQLCVYDPTVSDRPLPCFMGTYHAGPEESSPVSLCVCSPKTDTATENKKYTPYFTVGHKVMVSLTTVTPDVWRFWYQYDDLTAFGGNIFLAGNIALDGNINGGYGIWNARGCDSKAIVVN